MEFTVRYFPWIYERNTKNLAYDLKRNITSIGLPPPSISMIGF